MLKAFTLAVVGLAAVASAYPDADKVTTLDQMPDLSFGMYSGYVPIDGTKKQLHYLAALSKNDPVNDPVIIWFNGGPGCSSMLGFLAEHGPYVMPDGTDTFVSNDWSWNNEANMFYIESPADVGFSLCPDKTECVWTDENTADDNLVAVLNMLKKFPEINKNPLFISGESYGGIYVPKLASRLNAYIVKNKDDPTAYVPDFKGFMVGNGVTDWKYDTFPAFIEMAYWHGLYDDDTYNALKTNKCDFSYFEFDGDKISDACKKLVDRFNDLTADINVYDVFGKCYKSESFFKLHGSSEFGLLKSDSGLRAYKKYFTAEDYTPWMRRNKFNQDKKLKEIPPCVWAKPFIGYLNDPKVRDQLHIDKSAPTWDICADVDYTTSRTGSIEVYTELKGLYKMLKYTGDADGSVPTYGTLQWIKDLDWKITDEWRPYFIMDDAGNQQVAGYTESREGGFTLATVHGAGHMAPQWKRQQTYHAIFNFVKGNPL